MKDQLIVTVIYSVLFLSLFAIGEFLYHKLNFKAESTRKLVHVFTGLICFSFPIFVSTHWVVLFLTISFALILVLSMRFNLLKSINAIERKTSGSFLFPISIYVMYWAYSIFGQGNFTGNDLVWTSSSDLYGLLGDKAGIYYFLPLLIFSISDPLAAMCGKKWPYGKYSIRKETKTFLGSTAFLLSSITISFVFLVNQSSNFSMALLFSVFLGIGTTAAEGISQKGFDNLFIPIAAIAILILLR